MNIDDILEGLKCKEHKYIAQAISIIDNNDLLKKDMLDAISSNNNNKSIRIGITGPPGAGKSSITNQLIKKIRSDDKSVCALLVDPTSPFSSGAVLGDRIRINDCHDDKNVFIRSLASRGSKGGLASSIDSISDIVEYAGFDIILFETVGVGQVELDVIESVDSVVVVLVPESGDDIQIMKAGLIEIADLYVINKSDRKDADKLFIVLNNMLQLLNSEDWTPKIIKTVAIDNIGIDDLIVSLSEHNDYLINSNELNIKNRDRYVKKIKNIIIDEFERSFWTSERIDFLYNKISENKLKKLDLNKMIIDLKKI